MGGVESTSVVAETSAEVLTAVKAKPPPVILIFGESLASLQLNDAGLTPAEMGYLSECLRASTTNLVEANFQGNFFGPDGMKQLAEWLKVTTTLQKLNLEANNLGAEGMKYLSEALKVNSSILTVCLGSNGLTSQELVVLSNCLKVNSTLTFIDFEDVVYNNSNRILIPQDQFQVMVGEIQRQNLCIEEIKWKTNTRIHAMVSITIKRLKVPIMKGAASSSEQVLLGLQTKTPFTISPSMKMLSLRNKALTAADTRFLFKQLTDNTTITSLDLGGNELRADGAKLLADAIRSNSALTELDLFGNKIGADGVRWLSESLAGNTHLTKLLLGDNGIGGEGMKHLADCLKKNSTLRELSLRAGGITSGDDLSGVEHLSDCLKVNRSIVDLYLLGNGLGPEGMKILAQGLEVNATITALNLESNNIGSQGIPHLSECLKTNASITSLYVEGNGFEASDLSVLTACLTSNKSLTYIDWGRYKYSSSSLNLKATGRYNSCMTIDDLAPVVEGLKLTNPHLTSITWKVLPAPDTHLIGSISIQRSPKETPALPSQT